MRALFDRLLDASGWDWGSLPDYIVAVTAIVSAVLVLRQLSSLSEDRRQGEATRLLQLDQFRSEAESARANLLLRIDEQFEGGGVFRSRTRWVELRAACLQTFDPQNPALPPRETFISACMIMKLNALWDRLQMRGSALPDDAVRDYNLVTRLPNWIETIGMLAKEGLVPVADLKRLYGAVVRMTMEPIAGHLEHRRVIYPNSTAFENALWLNDAIARD